MILPSKTKATLSSAGAPEPAADSVAARFREELREGRARTSDPDEQTAIDRALGEGLWALEKVESNRVD